MSRQPLGDFLVAGLAAGLAGYILWMFIRAIADPEGAGSSLKGVVKRIGYVISGLVYAGIITGASRLVLNLGKPPDPNPTGDWISLALSHPFGPWALSLAGLFFWGLALYRLYRAWSMRFLQNIKTHEMDQERHAMTKRAGQLGEITQGVISTMIGLLLIHDGLENTRQDVGLGEALNELARRPYGPWLVGLVALGLLAYGGYAILQARYRQMGWEKERSS